MTSIPSFTKQDLEQYNSIERLINSGDSVAIAQCIHIHTIAPPERRLNVMQMLLDHNNVELAQTVFPHLDWRIERQHFKSIAKKNSTEWTELFYQYAHPSDNNWEVIRVMVERNASLGLSVVLQHNPPLYFIERAIKQSIDSQHTASLNAFIPHLHKQHPTFDLFPFVLDSLSENMDCSPAFSQCLNNEQLNFILLQLSSLFQYNTVFDSLKKASIFRNFAEKCSEIKYTNAEHDSNIESTFEELLEGALLLNDDTYLKHLLYNSNIKCNAGHIQKFFNSYDFFVDICSAKTPPDEHAYLFKLAVSNNNLDIALFLYDTSVRREDIDDVIEKHNKYQQSNPNYSNPFLPFLHILEHRQLLFDTLANNPEATSQPKRKL